MDVEPQEGVYCWDKLENQLTRAKRLGCKMIIRVSPYGFEGNGPGQDVPDWFRAKNPDRPEFAFWQVDPHTSGYVEYWTRVIREFGKKFDGHPYIQSIDMAIVGSWGEGGGTEFLEDWALHAIVDAYFEAFKITPLQCMLHDPRSVEYIRSKNRPVGFRVDCLGDMGGFHGDDWSHMTDFYPQNIGNFGMSDAWKTGPVVFEACWHTNDWFRHGWDIDYIIDESLKWHITNYNGKQSTVPEEWKPQVTRWLKKMGYRYEIRRATFASEVEANGCLEYDLHWVNAGVAPTYHMYPMAFRLIAGGKSAVMVTDADPRKWLPDIDIITRGCVKLPAEITAGEYELQVALLCDLPEIGNIQLGIGGRTEDGWYPLGKVLVK